MCTISLFYIYMITTCEFGSNKNHIYTGYDSGDNYYGTNQLIVMDMELI